MIEENIIQNNEEKLMQKCLGFSRKIGNTTYQVSGYYSDTATETIESKMKKIIKEDIKPNNLKQRINNCITAIYNNVISLQTSHIQKGTV